MSAFNAHCKKIVDDYVQTVLIIDDGACLGPSKNSDLDAEELETPDESNPMTTSFSTPQEQSKGEEQDDDSKRDQVTHPLDTLSLSNAFYDRGIVAGIYQPQIGDGQDPSEFALNAMKVSATADIIILDWMLVDHDARYSQEIVKQILEHDKKNGGRLRTIVVYTGETDLFKLRNDLHNFLNDETLEISGEYKISGEHLRIVFYQKKAIIAGPQAVYEVELPEKALEELSSLVNGLVPAFAMKASSAIRNSTGRLLSKFSRELDLGYLSHRALLPHATDSEVFMLESLVSYLRNILAIQQVDKYALDAEQIDNWVEDHHGSLSKKFSFSTTEDIEISKEQLANFLSKGFSCSIENVLVANGKTEKKALEFKSSKRKMLGLISVLNSGDLISSESAKNLSVLTTFRRVFSDLVGDMELPYLTQGSVLYRKSNRELYLCVTPKCDTARVSEVRAFSFTKLTRLKEGQKVDIVLPLPCSVKEVINTDLEQSISSVRERLGYDVESPELTPEIKQSNDYKTGKKDVDELRALQIKNHALVSTGTTFYDLTHINFSGNHDLRVMPELDEERNIVFKSEESEEFVWIGDLEDSDAQKRVANLVGNFNRIGTDEVEWLRRQYQ